MNNQDRTLTVLDSRNRAYLVDLNSVGASLFSKLSKADAGVEVVHGDYASIEMRALCHMYHDEYQFKVDKCRKVYAFMRSLHKEDKVLCLKWLYGAVLSNIERDTLQRIANGVRGHQ